MKNYQIAALLLLSIGSLPPLQAGPQGMPWPTPAAKPKAQPSPLILSEFSPVVSLGDIRAVRALIRKYQEFLGLLEDKKEGEAKLFAKTERGKWPLYLKKNDLGRKTLMGALKFMVEQLEGIESRLHEHETLKLRTPEVYRFLEVHQSLNLYFKDPVKRSLSLSYGLYRYAKSHLDFPLGRGDHDPRDGGDLSQNPVDDSLWTKPTDLANKDLKLGFDRKQSIPQIIEKLEKPCTYHEPKTSNGTSPGATLKCGKNQIKIKFKETKSEAFATRIFWALGFNVDPVDYMKSIKFVYDRNFFKEINSRRSLDFDITTFGIPVSHFTITEIVDPFDMIQGAVLKSGKRVSSAQLKAMLIGSKNPDFKKLKDGDFRAEMEKEIELLVTNEVQVQEKPEKTDDFVKLGPWDWNGLDHFDRKDMRGTLAAAAWLGWHDCRFDNNRLLLIRDEKTGKLKLKHMLSDLGGTLGIADDFTDTQAQRPDRFPEYVSSYDFLTGMHIVNLSLLDRNKAYEESTLKDMQWGLQYLNQLTQNQIWDAARASGFTKDESNTLLRKLVSRRYYLSQHAELGSR